MFNYFLTILSPLILALAFPKFNFFPLAWAGLVPLLLALDGKTLKRSFALGYLAGLIYFTLMIYWLGYVTLLGTTLFILYLALYFAVFSVGVYCVRNFPVVLKAFVLSSFWVVLEFARNVIFTGFGWASLGQSQTPFLAIIQIADLFGMHSISFLIVMANVCVYEWIVAYRKGKPKPVVLSIIIIVLVISAVVYGTVRLKTLNVTDEIKLGVIQGNIPQQDKWAEFRWPAILEKQIDLTQSLIDQDDPELIIWPETSYPGILWDDIELYQELIDKMRDFNTPLLLGSAMHREGQYFNSALLIDAAGELRQIYDKIHLVPFGEYVPFRNILPILTDIVPIGDFSSGEDYTLFDSFEKDYQFGVLICFEDTLSYLGRNYVNKEADFLVNITNDAWFEDTKAPFLHLASSIFRSVENRRSMIRAANTGVSAFVAPTGRVINYVHKEGEKTFVEGVLTEKVPIIRKQTFFNKHPHFFAYFCFVCILSGLIYHLRNNNIKRKQQGVKT